MTSTPPATVPREAAEQAIGWLIELQASPADPALRQAWQEWRQRAPEHEQAWSRIEAMNQRLAGLPESAARALLEGPRSPRRRQALKALGAFAGVGVAGGALLYARGDLQRWPADLATRVGERRRLRLDDGSVVQLNTDSAIDVALGQDHRRIRLRRGEIHIQTARDPRPMWVDCSEGTLQPLGTRFGVRLLAGQVRVFVEQGRVRIGSREGGTLELPAGQQVEFDRRRLGNPTPLLPGSDGWIDGVLSVSDMPLGEFLAELSRYRPGRLGCEPQIASLRISGTFPLEDSDRILAMLPRVLPVQVHQLTRYWVTVSPRAG